MLHPRITDRPDLRPLFGPLTPEGHARLLDRFFVVQTRLLHLAEQATAHIGVPYQLAGLTLVRRLDGTAAGIHGGPTGDAGDIWFDISFSPELSRGIAGPRWVLESDFIVFCCDSPEPRGSANTHPIAHVEGAAETPDTLVDLLESHIAFMEAELPKRPREFYTATPHAALPSWLQGAG